MKNDYELIKSVTQELRDIAVGLKCVVITTHQARPIGRRSPPDTTSDIIFIDYCGLIR